MGGWSLAIDLSTQDEGPLFLRIARAVILDVQRGRLRPGDELPGSRALAVSLGVHRNTVLAAYRELSAEGWVTSDPARGTFVSADLPEVAPRRFAPLQPVSSRVGYALPEETARLVLPPAAGLLSLNGGIPDVRLVPTAAIARAYRRALRRGGKALLGYSDPRGCPELRAAIAQMLSATRGVAAGPSEVMVTRGSQMAIDLVGRTLLHPGSRVAVEALGYRPAWDALRAAGMVLEPVPLDDGGMIVDRLVALSDDPRDGGLRAVYLTPHHQYPTTAVLTPGRRIALLDLARRKRLLVIEDDYDHEFHYDGRPILPLASADRAGVVVYVGTLSKVLAPGLRVGYLVAPASIVDRVAARRALVDRQGDHAIEWAVAELLDDGEVQRHVRRARRVYAERRDTLCRLLDEHLGDVLTFRSPAGGTALWARVAAGVDVGRWASRALELGVSMQTGQAFAFDGRSRHNVRLGFAQLSATELKEAIVRLASALRPDAGRARSRRVGKGRALL